MIWNLRKYSDREALHDDSGRWMTYASLAEEQDRLAGVIGRRCLVFCLCENSIGSVLGYSTFVNHGIVAALLNKHIESAFFTNLIEIYQPAFLWVPVALEKNYEGHVLYKAAGYSLIQRPNGGCFPMHESLALLMTTSGSTGSPKFVRQSYENISDNTKNICKYLELDETERPVTTLPMNYTYGLSIINTHLAVGATVFLTDHSLMQKEFWSLFKEQEITSFGGVPYTYEMLEKLRFTRMDLPSLRTMTQAGGKLSPELHEKFALYAKNHRKKFVVMYGQCEATARMGYLPPEMAEKKKGFMGIAIPGGQFRLVDETGNEIKEPYMTGELVYRGKNVTLGYAESGEDLERGNERGGVLVTGDMAQFDEAGYYKIVGRKSRFLKIYGNRVNLDEMDRLLKERFKIEIACAGRDDHMTIFMTDNDRSEEIRSFAAQKTGLNQAAFRTVIVREIPRNDAGKVSYATLERLEDVV